MTALKQHPTHKESLLILLGLAPIPSNVVHEISKNKKSEQYFGENRSYDTYGTKEKKRFSDAVIAIINTGVHFESDIISCIEADEECTGTIIFPLGKKFGKRPPKETICNWIRDIKKKNNLQRSKFCDQLVPIALSGKTISAAVEIVGCKRATALNVYNALGLGAKRKKEFKKLKPSFVKRMNALADKYRNAGSING